MVKQIWKNPDITLAGAPKILNSNTKTDPDTHPSLHETTLPIRPVPFPSRMRRDWEQIVKPQYTGRQSDKTESKYLYESKNWKQIK